MNYPISTIQRARRAVSCSPFERKLFDTMRLKSVSLHEIAGQSGATQGYTVKVLPEGSAERSLLWLIQVGLLRREVDGQGLTNSFRLTPLGRLLVEQWQEQGNRFRRISWGDRFRELGRQLISGAF
ncbi:MAG: hypothetical protein MH252_00175 [Thermosynechococcaceae cyanobacterium MS004]|nr:hypothetical protein [Thermosynechococcaceae cyanobacterium MS004]